MEAKDRNTEAATVADELKAQRRTLTADEMKIIYFTKGEIQELETLARHEASMDAPRFLIPIFTRHAEKIATLCPENIELGRDVYLYAFVYDTDIGGMLQDMAQYAETIDDALKLHNRIAKHGDNWLLIAEGMRRAFWYYHACMIREMGGEEYAHAIAAFHNSGSKPEYIILTDMPTAGKTDEELEKERGKNLILLREEERLLLNIPAELRLKVFDAFMRWHLGYDGKLDDGIAEMMLQPLIGRQLRCLAVSKTKGNAGGVKSEAKAAAARENGRHGGRPPKHPKTKTQQKPNRNPTNTDTDTVTNSPSLDSILSNKNILPDTDTVTDNRRVSVSVSGTGRKFDPWKCADDEIRDSHTAVEVLTLALGKGAWRRAVDEAGENGEEGIKELFITFRAEIRAGEDVENRAAAFTARLKKEFGVLANNATGEDSKKSPLAERRKKTSIYGSGKIGIPKRLVITDADDYENRF